MIIKTFSYHCRVSIKAKENEKTLTMIMKEVKGLNPTFDGADIRGQSLLIYLKVLPLCPYPPSQFSGTNGTAPRMHA